MTTPKTTPKKGVYQRNQILQIIRVTPDISKERISELLDLTVDGVKYHLRKLKSEGRIEWVGPMKSGYWKIIWLDAQNQENNQNENMEVTEKVIENPNTGQVIGQAAGQASQKEDKKVIEKVTENTEKVIEKVIEKAAFFGDRLTENKIRILQLVIEKPQISKVEISKMIGISPNSVSRNIEAMREKYIRRIGPDKGGFWEVIV